MYTQKDFVGLNIMKKVEMIIEKNIIIVYQHKKDLMKQMVEIGIKRGGINEYN